MAREPIALPLPPVPPGLRRSSVGSRLLLAALVLVVAPSLSGQSVPQGPDAEPYRVPRIDGPIELDGRVDKPVWQAIEPLHAVGHTPDFGAVPSERTEIRLAHDGTHLYFSCRAFDSQPELMQGSSYRRDDTAFNSDRCMMYIDSLNDAENALGFGTTPAGIRQDLTMQNDAQGPPNWDWNSFWDVVVTRDAEGWHAEHRIPFSSLILQEDENGEVLMGFSVLRTIARRNEFTTHPAMSPEYGFASFAKPSQMRKLVLDGVEAARPVYVTPYVLGGGGYTHSLSTGDDAWRRNSDRTAEAGFDLRTSLTPNLNLDLTVNTDFAQVEADDQQVNLTRFPLFFPEKRRFFQERSATFEYGLGGQDRLFHSRRIGLADGAPVRIYGGGRVVGRIGEWDVGVINMQTAESDRLPSENQGVVRLRRRVLNANSYLGGILTSRTGSGGHYNVVYGLDGILRLFGDEYLTLNWSQSFDDGVDGAVLDSPLDHAVVRMQWERRRQDLLNYSLSYMRTGGFFEPGLGFLRRRNVEQVAANAGYGWRPANPASRFVRSSISAGGSAFRRLEDRVVESVSANVRGTLETRAGHQWTASVFLTREDLPAPLNLPEGTRVPVGRYAFLTGRLQYQAPQGGLIRTSAALEAGEFYDGTAWQVSFGPTWSVSPNLSLSGNYQLVHANFAEREESFTSHVARLRAEVMFSVHTSLATFVQYNHTDDAFVANLRFRYNPREGNDFYIVWNEGLVTDPDAFDPVRPRADARTILVKYAHTFTLGL